MSGSDVRDAGAPKGVGDQPNDKPISESRRRWVLAALAGPAAVSLPARASLAAMGSMSTCVANLSSDPSIMLHCSPTEYSLDPKYARTQVQGILVEKGASNGYQSQALVVYANGEALDPNWRPWRPVGVDKWESPDGVTFKDKGQRVARETLVFYDSVNLTDTPIAGAMPLSNSCYVSVSALNMMN